MLVCVCLFSYTIYSIDTLSSHKNERGSFTKLPAPSPFRKDGRSVSGCGQAVFLHVGGGAPQGTLCSCMC
jgi:hypothetical protein